MAYAYGPNVIMNNLVFFLDAANHRSYFENEYWKDLSKTVGQVIFANIPTYSTENGGILTFDGTNDYGLMISPELSTTWTISGWINPDNQSRELINPTSNNGNQSISYDNSGAIRVNICSDTGVNVRNRLSTIGSVPVNQWTNFTITFNDLDINIYINGVLDSSFTETLSLSTWTENWYIGCSDSVSSFYSGKLSNLLIYNTVLSSDNILQNYNAFKSRFILT